VEEERNGEHAQNGHGGLSKISKDLLVRKEKLALEVKKYAQSRGNKASKSIREMLSQVEREIEEDAGYEEPPIRAAAGRSEDARREYGGKAEAAEPSPAPNAELKDAARNRDAARDGLK